MGADILLYTVFGRPFRMIGMNFAVRPYDTQQIADFCAKMPRLIDRGMLRPNPLKVWKGSLAAIPEGMQYIKDGKHSAEKNVFKL